MSSIPTILQEIIAEKNREVVARRKIFSIAVIEGVIADMPESTRGFYASMKSKVEAGNNAVIAEIKKASPSKGIIREYFDPAAIAKSYEKHGATCLSILTDEKFFQGCELYLDEARNATKLPVLRKDFIINEYQIYESKAMGADCILLIAACLEHKQMLDFTRLAYDLGMDVLVEVHNLEELDKVANLPLRMIGINNRDLHTFTVDLTTTFDLSTQIPDEIMIVTESGIMNRNDVQIMNGIGINSFLVGEAMMRHDSPGQKLAELFA